MPLGSTILVPALFKELARFRVALGMIPCRHALVYRCVSLYKNIQMHVQYESVTHVICYSVSFLFDTSRNFIFCYIRFSSYFLRICTALFISLTTVTIPECRRSLPPMCDGIPDSYGTRRNCYMCAGMSSDLFNSVKPLICRV